VQQADEFKDNELLEF